MSPSLYQAIEVTEQIAKATRRLQSHGKVRTFTPVPPLRGRRSDGWAPPHARVLHTAGAGTHWSHGPGRGRGLLLRGTLKVDQRPLSVRLGHVQPPHGRAGLEPHLARRPAPRKGAGRRPSSVCWSSVRSSSTVSCSFRSRPPRAHRSTSTRTSNRACVRWPSDRSSRQRSM